MPNALRGAIRWWSFRPNFLVADSEDGRRLRVEVAGSGDRMILAQLGTPNAGLLFEPWVRDAGGRGLSLVTYDHPGYGGSSAQPGRSPIA